MNFIERYFLTILFTNFNLSKKQFLFTLQYINVQL